MLCCILSSADSKSCLPPFWTDDGMEQTGGRLLLWECLQHVPRQEASRSRCEEALSCHATEEWQSFCLWKKTMDAVYFIGICVAAQRPHFPHASSNVLGQDSLMVKTGSCSRLTGVKPGLACVIQIVGCKPVQAMETLLVSISTSPKWA